MRHKLIINTYKELPNSQKVLVHQWSYNEPFDRDHIISEIEQFAEEEKGGIDEYTHMKFFDEYWESNEGEFDTVHELGIIEWEEGVHKIKEYLS